MRRSFVIALVVATATGTSTAPARAHPAYAKPDATIRALRVPPFIGKGVFGEDGAGQTVETRIQPGAFRTFVVRVDNVGTTGGDFTVSGRGNGTEFTVTYLEGLDGSTDITDEVVAGTYVMGDVQVGHHRFIRIVVTAAADAPTGAERGFLVRAAWISDEIDAVRARVRVPPIRMSGIGGNGKLRCTASFPDRELQPGYATHVRFSLTNISDRTVTAFPLFGWLEFRDAQGDVLGETDPGAWWGPAPVPRRIHPGRTIHLLAFDTRVRWSGPLTIEATCQGIHADLPPRAFPVAVPGETPSPVDAIAAAVDASDVFEACAPQDRIHAVTAELAAPEPEVPPLPVRCWADVRVEPGFDVVTLFLVSPSTSPRYEVPEDPLTNLGAQPGEGSFAAARWDWVVTELDARPLLAASQARTPRSDSYAPFYEFRNGEWNRWGVFRCGFWGAAVSGSGTTFMLEWVSACPNPPEGAPPPPPDRRVITRVE